MARDQKFKFAVTGKIISGSQTTDHCERDYYKYGSELYTLGLWGQVVGGITWPMAWYWSRTIFRDLPLPEKCTVSE